MENENTIQQDDVRLGYSKEDDYFNRINQILVAKLKSPETCPKCNGRSTPLVRDGVVMNQCTQCSNEFQSRDESDPSAMPS